MFHKNSLNRKIPTELFGKKYQSYKGAYATPPKGVKVGRKYKSTITRERKVYDDLEKVIAQTGLKNGDTVGFIHNLRYGDFVVNMVMDTISSMGIKNLTLASTALFPNHEPLIEHIKSGVISEISGSMNGPIGKAVSTGEINIPTSLRSHGGRARAVECGDLHLDVSFVATPACDELGNMNGCQGPSAFGANGFANDTDSVYANCTVLVTDNLVTDEAIAPVSIRGNAVDYIVTVNKIGDPDKIVAGSLGRNIKDEHHAIATQVVNVALAAGYVKDGFSFQAGAGGVSLAAVEHFREEMEKGITGSFIHGGMTGPAAKLLEDGLFLRAYDGQSFDKLAIKSLRENPRHIESSAQNSYNIWSPGGPLASYVDVVALGATEVDVNFNVNVNTHSDGLLLHGIGGHTDAAAGRMTVITCPLARKVPIIIDNVLTISTPGEMVDVVITEAGIAVNPLRTDLTKKFSKADLKIIDINELRDMAYSQASPMEPDLTDEICTAVEYRDGTLMDVVYKVNH